MTNTATTAVATIAGQKAHIVPAKVLTEDMTVTVPAGWTFKAGRNVRRWKEETIPAGTTVYGAPICGTTRSNGDGMVWSNHIVLADEVTCRKCAERDAR